MLRITLAARCSYGGNCLQNRISADEAVTSHEVDVAEFVRKEFSKRQIREAGKALAAPIEVSDEAVQMFRIAHNFRMAHAFPLVIERQRLARISGSDADTSGRIKRMASIRKKLSKTTIHLDQMQDVAGVRCILPDIAAVERVVAKYRENYSGQIKAPVDYIAQPKNTGYRSVHIVKTYDGTRAEFVGMKVEIQVRTRLQHVWAAAQETIGILTANDLKGGQGDGRWQRLMALVSAFISQVEGQPVGEHVPTSWPQRRAELRELEAELGALKLLRAVKALRPYAESKVSRGGFFMLSLDADRSTIDVTPMDPYGQDSKRYLEARDRGERVQTLVVAVDDLEALTRTYPSYFLDVTEFVEILEQALLGTPPRPPGPDRHEGHDFSFLRDGAWRRPKTGGRLG